MRGVALLIGLAGIACQPPADDGYTLLFLGRSSAARVGRISWAPDAPRSRLVAFDGDLHVVRTIANPRISSPVAVSPYPNSQLLITERTGEGVVFDTAGNPVREWESPFPASLYATDDHRIYASRSPFFVQLIAEDGSVPLVWVLDTLGIRRGGLGTTHIPDIRYLAQLVNAGPVAARNGVVYFAPLTRDEIFRLDAAGSPVWRSSRGLIPVERDPALCRRTTERRVEHALINIAMTFGPPPRRPALRARRPGLRRDPAAARRARRRNGRDPGGPRPRHTGYRYCREPARPHPGPRPRHAARPDTHERTRVVRAGVRTCWTLTGKPVRLEDYRGKVTLVNFWASWCEPCRAEFPHMAELYRQTSRKDFDIAAISDDVSDAQMRAFVREFRPPFPILVGRGRMKGAYHFRGLPYSVVLDRQGRVIERIFGFGGEQEFRHLRDIISREIDADSAAVR